MWGGVCEEGVGVRRCGVGCFFFYQGLSLHVYGHIMHAF